MAVGYKMQRAHTPCKRKGKVTMDSTARTLVIVPAYNEEASIVATVDELRAVIPHVSYVVVNDGSTDRTEALCRAHGYNLVSHPVNLGLAGAFRTGMKYAARHGFDRAIQFDADGQHRPEAIAVLEEAMDASGADVVIGSRFVTRVKPRSLRMLGSDMISTIIRLTARSRIADPTSGMRLYGRRVIEEFARRDDLTPEPDTLAFLIRHRGIKVVERQVSMRERTAGESYLTLSRSVGYMANAFASILFAQWFRR